MLSMYSTVAKQYVSSTNLFYSFTLFLKFSITDVSSSTVNIALDPLNSLRHTIHLNVSFIIKCIKCLFFVQRINSSFISCFGMSVVIY